MPCQVLPCQGTTHRNWAFRLLLSLDNVLDSLRWRFQLHEAPNYGMWFPRQGLVEKSGHWKTEDVRYSGNRWARIWVSRGRRERMNGWMDESVNDASAVIHPSLSRSTGQAHPPVALAPTHAKKIPFHLTITVSVTNTNWRYWFTDFIGHSISFCLETTGHVQLPNSTHTSSFAPKYWAKNR